MDLELFHFLQELPVGLKCRGNSVLDIARGRSVSKYLLKHHYKTFTSRGHYLEEEAGRFCTYATVLP